ncbi:leucine-rich repeat protein kinase family protein [Actinidia rufa]|uniref:Leucine-rich repeat protein kinase family protein n=1 Tax=Actinidia rufa TaxID=165716 RepID=A0A7J0FSG4_9ERIC|nr:leucine-rich repeat protein kinase family protein [Actinidia rufa]
MLCHPHLMVFAPRSMELRSSPLSMSSISGPYRPPKVGLVAAAIVAVIPHEVVILMALVAMILVVVATIEAYQAFISVYENWMVSISAKEYQCLLAVESSATATHMTDTAFVYGLPFLPPKRSSRGEFKPVLGCYTFMPWSGVTCGLKHQRVTALDPEGRELHGAISPHLGNLSYLQILNLGSNSLSGGIPLELGHLFRFQNLRLSKNFLGGVISINLSQFSNLINLALDQNYLDSEIPSELGSLSNLVNLSLENNNLTGKFPASLGNLSSLKTALFIILQFGGRDSRYSSPNEKFDHFQGCN